MKFEYKTTQLNKVYRMGLKNYSAKGFSMVELLIAGFLGIVLIGGVVQLFLGSNQNYRMQDDLATMQEDGRFALLFLNDQIQMGGWLSDYNNDVIEGVNFNADNSSDGDTDKLTVQRQSTATVDNFDCTGAEVNGDIINQFYVSKEAGEEVGDLVCLGNALGAVAQPLVGNVQDMQVMYGVEGDTVSGLCRTGRVDQYMNAAAVVANGYAQRVISVKVALLLRSDDELLPEAKAQAYKLLDKTVNVNDRYMRRVFSKTVFIPNNVYNYTGSTENFRDCN